MFQLTAEEAETLRSQFATSKGRGGRRYIPYAFTELGVAMLSSAGKAEAADRILIRRGGEGGMEDKAVMCIDKLTLRPMLL
jgi:hypothetical protein